MSRPALLKVWTRMRALLIKEFLQLLRDPRMRFILVVPPVLQLFLFGYAATFDVRQADVAVVNYDNSQVSRELLAAITATGHYTLKHLPNMEVAGSAMDHNDVRVILQIPARFSANRTVQLIADGSDPNSAALILGEVNRIINQHAQQVAGIAPPVTVEERAWYNPNLEDRWFFVPGIMANVVFVSTMMLTAMLVVREREIGTLERMLVTPVARLEFLVGKMVPVGCVGLLDVLMIASIAIAWFGVPFRGSLGALILASLLLLLSTQGLGLLVSTYAATQQQAMLSAGFFIMPLMILSGFAFPIRNMPEALQWLSYIDPMRYYLVVIRDLFLKGGGVGDHLFDYAMMLLLGAGTLGLSVLRVR
jgi:ABC-2 type transport system permease protein